MCFFRKIVELVIDATRLHQGAIQSHCYKFSSGWCLRAKHVIDARSKFLVSYMGLVSWSLFFLFLFFSFWHKLKNQLQKNPKHNQSELTNVARVKIEWSWIFDDKGLVGPVPHPFIHNVTFISNVIVDVARKLWYKIAEGSVKTMSF